MSESVPVVDEEGGKAETVLSSSFHLRPSLRGDDGDDFLEVDEDNGHQESHQDVKTCPYPFSCFNGRNLFRQKTNDATGVVYLDCAKNIANVSNLFYATGLLYLAQNSIIDHQCNDLEQQGVDQNTSGGSISCLNDNKILGFNPVSLVTNVWTISGILSALFLPFIGSVLDHSKYRWEVGLAVSACIVLIQAAQIATNEKTWLVMTGLEAINASITQITLLCSAAYMTEVQEQVTSDEFSKINTVKFLAGFSNTIGLLVIIVAAGYIWGFNDLQMAQFSQAIGSVLMCVFFYLTWYFLGKRGPAKDVPERENLATAGFKQMLRTAKGLFLYYKRSVFLFFLATSFTSAGVDGLSIVLVTYLKASLLLDSSQIAIVLAILLVSSIPGAICAHWLASKSTPIAALKITVVYSIVLNLCVFKWLEEDMFLETCISSIGWGLIIGLYYPLLHLVFSIIVPKGQEAELSGFFIYCTVVLSWVFPLGATLLNEYSDLKWSGALFSGCMFIGLIFLSFMLPWNQCVDSAKVNLMTT